MKLLVEPIFKKNSSNLIG